MTVDAHIQPTEWTDRQDLETFIGPNAAPYLHLYDRGAKQYWRNFSFCWPAFFFPVPWVMYRKMYLFAAAILLIPIVAVVAFPVLESGLGAGMAVALAGISHPYYLSFAERKIRKISAQATSPEDRAERLKRAGGTSVAGAVIGTVIYLSLIALAVQTRT